MQSSTPDISYHFVKDARKTCTSDQSWHIEQDLIINKKNNTIYKNIVINSTIFRILSVNIIDRSISLGFLKAKFDIPPVPREWHVDSINFWKILLLSKLFQISESLHKKYMCFFGSIYGCEQAFSSMKLIKNKHRSRTTDENSKNSR